MVFQNGTWLQVSTQHALAGVANSFVSCWCFRKENSLGLGWTNLQTSECSWWRPKEWRCWEPSGLWVWRPWKWELLNPWEGLLGPWRAKPGPSQALTLTAAGVGTRCRWLAASPGDAGGHMVSGNSAKTPGWAGHSGAEPLSEPPSGTHLPPGRRGVPTMTKSQCPSPWEGGILTSFHLI